MRFIKFTAAAQTSWGILEGDRIAAISGEPFDKFKRTGRAYALAEVKIEVPLIPRTFYCAGPQLRASPQGGGRQARRSSEHPDPG